MTSNPYFADPTDPLRPLIDSCPNTMHPGHRIPEPVRHEIALFLEAAGARPRCSSDIAGNVMRGYGRLDEWGWFEFEL